MKEKITKLTSDEIRTYLKQGKVEVNGLEVVTGMLTVSKQFKPAIQQDKAWACASSMRNAVMLDIQQTEELK